MMAGEALAGWKRTIWPSDAVRPVRIFAVLDCARSPLVYSLISRSYREKSCLFAGDLDPELARSAPYLLELQPGDSITDEVLRGCEDAWGILIQSESSFRSLRRHLRTLLRVQTEQGRFLLFRFYDPRVLKAYLPTCTKEELESFFGQDFSAVFVLTSGQKEAQAFRLDSGELARAASSNQRGPAGLQVTIGPQPGGL